MSNADLCGTILRRHAGAPVALLFGAGLALFAQPQAALAASAAGCEGGGFTVTAPGVAVSGTGSFTIAAAALTQPLLVKGRYVQFAVVPASFGIRDWLFTGAANPLDQTGGRRTVMWQEKTPDHRGLLLTGNASVEIAGDSISLARAGLGLGMKIQAKDCANGGIFQMEVERADNSTTRFTHVLADGVFYYDNPNFRAREGDVVPYKDTTVTVAARINVGNDLSPRLVGRDSPQVATRVSETSCTNLIPTRFVNPATVRHCGRVSRWDVASGGRMGWVTGEDATEVAPPATACTRKCQAQNRVRGQAVNLGAPFPVPAASRLQPAFPTPFP